MPDCPNCAKLHAAIVEEQRLSALKVKSVKAQRDSLAVRLLEAKGMWLQFSQFLSEHDLGKAGMRLDELLCRNDPITAPPSAPSDIEDQLECFRALTTELSKPSAPAVKCTCDETYYCGCDDREIAAKQSPPSAPVPTPEAISLVSWQESAALLKATVDACDEVVFGQPPAPAAPKKCPCGGAILNGYCQKCGGLHGSLPAKSEG